MIGLSYEAEDVSSTGTFCPSFCYGYLGYGRRKRNAAVCPSYCYAVNMGRKRRGIPGGSNQASVHSLLIEHVAIRGSQRDVVYLG